MNIVSVLVMMMMMINESMMDDDWWIYYGPHKKLVTYDMCYIPTNPLSDPVKYLIQHVNVWLWTLCLSVATAGPTRACPGGICDLLATSNWCDMTGLTDWIDWTTTQNPET